MRAIPPPERGIGAFAGDEIRDNRRVFMHTGPICHSEDEFDKYILSGLMKGIPPAMKRVLARRLRTDHRVVFTHGSLAPRNIIARDGKIVALLGWYLEYWEYVKLLQQNKNLARMGLADEIFA